MSIRVLDQKKLTPFLKRHMQATPDLDELRLDEFLVLVLEKSIEFVPSSIGVVYLDDPAGKKLRVRSKNILVSVAVLGGAGNKFRLGARKKVSSGVVGRVYVQGQPYYNQKEICVPISIRGSIVGVLQLIKKKNGDPYTLSDFELLRIFADYISASIQNFLDAKRLADLAFIDNLTGLFNDRHFDRVLKKEVGLSWRSNKDLCLIFVDLDQFKEINDRYGHLVGSQVLVEVAKLLEETVLAKRATLARYGGDEYLILLPQTSLSQAVLMAEKVRAAVEKAVFLTNSTIEGALTAPSSIKEAKPMNLRGALTASFGVASLKEHVGKRDRGLLLKLADQAMYLAKSAGKNKVFTADSIVKNPRRTRSLHWN